MGVSTDVAQTMDTLDLIPTGGLSSIAVERVGGVVTERDEVMDD